MPAVTPLAAREVTRFTLAVPLNDTAAAVISPVALKFLAVDKASAKLAVP